jgi:hypothetical protein
MPLFREKHNEHTEPVDVPARPLPAGPHLLFDGPVLAEWFVLYRLGQEIERSRRYGSCLSILVAEPQLIVGELVAPAGRIAAAEAANKSARNTDLVGWLDESRIIVVLPEADAASARFVASRLRDEIWIVSHSQGGQKWQIQLVDDLDEIQAILPLATATDQAA